MRHGRQQQCDLAPLFPTQYATKFDVMAGQLTGATTYLGEYPAPGAGSRWASKEKLGANCEEEYVNGELTFVCYVH